MTPYYDALTRAMTSLARDHRALFLGQTVADEGTVAHGTFVDVPAEQKLEFPVAEELQLGVAIGLALQDPSRPVLCFYPRINFLLRAIDQLVSHLDKMPFYASVWPHVIVRTAVAHDHPLNPGPQHLGDYFPNLRGMLENIHAVRVYTAEEVHAAYSEAAQRDGPSLIVEYMEHYFDD